MLFRGVAKVASLSVKLPTLLLLISAIGFAMHFHEIVERLTPHPSGSGWVEDEPQALLDAKSENKFVLLRFTGSDWCGVCKALDREVLSRDEFKQMAIENFVLVDVDFPRRKSQSSKLREQNGNLLKQYHIQGVPTVVVLNSNGVAVQELGYHPGAPARFLEELKRFRRIGNFLPGSVHPATTSPEDG